MDVECEGVGVKRRYMSIFFSVVNIDSLTVVEGRG